MAWDEGEAELLRGEFEAAAHLSEKAMFGGLVFLSDGNMLGGVMSQKTGGAIFRVGKAQMAEACALPEVDPMMMGGRAMSGFVGVTSDGLADDETRRALARMAVAFVRSLPPK